MAKQDQVRIKMLTSIGGVDFSVNANEEVDCGRKGDRFTRKEAIAMVERGMAVPVASPIERAVKRGATETRGSVAKAVKAVKRAVTGK